MARRLAAILAADMVGYSRLMASDELGTVELLRNCRRLYFEPEISRFGGEIVKLTGDGLLVIFDSVVNAVEAAAAVQTSMATANADEPNKNRIDFRIGLHVGDVILGEDDIYGDGINVAARLEAIADPGGVIVSDDVYRHARGKTDISFVDLGELELKNIPEALRCYKISPSDKAESTLSPTGKFSSDKPSIAVLPFQNMSADPEQEYFCDGVSEDIITELSRFPELFVIARNSSFSFKNKTVTHNDIARELSVRYMLEGSLRRAANRLRITAQLIECETGAHIWAERYDRSVENIFELQDEITSSVVGAIAPQITQAELERATRERNIQFSSYDLALRAMALFHEGGFSSNEGYEAVVTTAQRALDIDPRNALALWIQAYAHTMRYLFQVDEKPEEMLNLAQKAADALFQRDRLDPRALTIRGMIRHFQQAYDEATADFQRAFELNPNFALNIFFMAWHESLVGRTDEAKMHAQLALRLSPRDADVWVGDAYLALAQSHFAEGDFEKVQEWGKLAVQFTPRAPIRRALLIASAAHLGRSDDGTVHAEALASFAPTFLDSIVSGRLSLYRQPKHNALLIDGILKSGCNLR